MAASTCSHDYSAQTPRKAWTPVFLILLTKSSSLYETLFCRVMSLSRASLLEAKALPPLIRLRRKLEAATTAAVADTSALAAEPEPERARHDCAGSIPAAVASKGSILAEGGAGLPGRTSRQGERDDEVERVHSSDSEQPPLEAMVCLIVNQMVGRTSSCTAGKAPVNR